MISPLDSIEVKVYYFKLKGHYQPILVRAAIRFQVPPAPERTRI